jgi:hypothetical protein
VKLFLAEIILESFQYHTEGSYEKENLLRLVWAADEKAAITLIKRKFEVDIPHDRCTSVEVEVSAAIMEGE